MLELWCCWVQSSVQMYCIYKPSFHKSNIAIDIRSIDEWSAGMQWLRQNQLNVQVCAVLQCKSLVQQSDNIDRQHRLLQKAI